MLREKRDEIRQKLWRSLELKVLKRDLIMYCIMEAVFLVIYPISRYKRMEFWLYMGILQAVIVPFVGFSLWRMWSIFRKAELYTFHRCVLAKPHSSPFLKRMYFDVVIDTPGGLVVRETHAIFAHHGIIDPRMEDYVNETVTVAYNSETEQVVVIG